MSQTSAQSTLPRQHWMSILATADTHELLQRSQPLVGEHIFDDVRTAEVGLAQVRGRMGGTGSPFNLGDMTITRCVVRSSEGLYGYSFVSGRDKEHARRAAELDALLQSKSHHELVREQVIEPLRDRLHQQDQAKQAQTASTRVNFFTLVRGED